MKKKNLFLLSLVLFFVGIFGVSTTSEAGLSGIYYKSHVRNIGWQEYVSSGQMSGTVGKNLPMEAFELQYNAYKPSSDSQILMRSHLQDVGWTGWTSGSTTGSTGYAKNMEAIQITLVGQFAEEYDIAYRVHVTNKGWLPWVKNGVTAGTTGNNLAMQAIEVKLVPKR